MPDGLAELFRYAASDLKKRLTPDPAGVSKPIKLPTDRDAVVGRLRRAAKRMRGCTGQRRRQDEGPGGDGWSVWELRQSARRKRIQGCNCLCTPQWKPSAWGLRGRIESRRRPQPKADQIVRK